MPKYHLRIITDSCSQPTVDELNRFFRALPGILDFRAEPLSPYWKNPEHGEILCEFTCSRSHEDIQAIFANCWKSDVTDVRWSHIFVPHTLFIWLNYFPDIV